MYLITAAQTIYPKVLIIFQSLMSGNTYCLWSDKQSENPGAKLPEHSLSLLPQ